MMAGCSFTSERCSASLGTNIVGVVFLGGVVLRVGLGRALFCEAEVTDFELWTPFVAAAPDKETFLRMLVGFAAFLGGVVLWVEPWGVVL